MNPYVKNYLELRNAQKRDEQQRQVRKLINNLRIGEKEYPEDSDYDREDYPYWDTDKGKYYRYNIGEISDDELEMLLDGEKDEPKYVETPTRSGWHGFATFMIILGGIAVIVVLFATLSEHRWHRDWTAFIAVLGGYLMELGFWAIVQLLANIKLGIDNLLLKMK